MVDPISQDSVSAYPARSALDDKANITEIEFGVLDGAPKAQGRIDYSGAAAKSDAAEIALVRKLDRRILPMLCAMYFLNYVSAAVHAVSICD